MRLNARLIGLGGIGLASAALQSAVQSPVDLLSLHKALVNTPSVSGNEHEVGSWLTSFLRAHDFTVEHQTLDPLPSASSSAGPRRNVYAYRGDSRKARLLVTSHIDTVPPFYPHEVRDGGEIWGRGSVDAKGSVAAQVAAVLGLAAEGKIGDGDAALLFVVGEEVSGDGMRKANDLGLAWEAVVFGEPTELKLASGHKGALALTLTAKGKAGHSGYPWLGENANSMLLPALLALETMDLPASDRYGNTTVNLGLMRGGVAANVIAEEAMALVQIRLAGGEPDDIKRAIRLVVGAVDDRIGVDFSLGYGPVPCDTDVDGFDVMSVNYGTDIPWLHGDHKRYLYGPGSILVAHSDHEHVSPDDLHAAVDGYRRIILSALGKDGGKDQGSVEL